MLERIDELARQRESFAFETTLSACSFAPLLRRLAEAGYSSRLVIIWLRDADVSIARVAERVQRGGHNIPPDIVRRRYIGGIKNLIEVYLPIVARWQIFDNTSRVFTLVAEGEATRTIRVEDELIWQEIHNQAGHAL